MQLCFATNAISEPIGTKRVIIEVVSLDPGVPVEIAKEVVNRKIMEKAKEHIIYEVEGSDEKHGRVPIGILNVATEI